MQLNLQQNESHHAQDKPNVFLIGHARRMRQCREKQRQRDPQQYKHRLNKQRNDYKLRTQFNVPTQAQYEQKIISKLKNRITNRKRQRRYRLYESIDKRNSRLIKDRRRKMVKSKRLLMKHVEIFTVPLAHSPLE